MAEARPYAFVSHASADNARLKPVLEGLLGFGLPVWFDKPNHDDIRIPDEKFVGFIKGGQSWSAAIDDWAIPDSSAFLIFPSSLCLTSVECTHEVKSAMTRWRTTGQRYFFAPLFLDTETMNKMHDDVDSFQGYRTFTQKTDTGWELTPDGATELERLVKHLRARFTEFEREPLTMLRAGVRLAGDDVLLVDRRAQADGAVLALSESDGALNQRQPLLITYGTEDQEPRGFGRVTLPKRVLSRASVAKQTSASGKPIELSWPSEAAKNAKDFALLLNGELARGLQGAGRSSGAPTPKLLAETISREGIARIALAQLPPTEKSFNTFIAAIQAWCAYWNEFPFTAASCDGQMTLIPALEIAFAHPEDRESELKSKLAQAKDGRSKKAVRDKLTVLRKRVRLERKVRKWLTVERNIQKLAAPFANIRLYALQELELITPQHVEYWVDHDDDTFRAWDHSARTSLRAKLQAVFEQAPELPMRIWAEKARPLLRP